MPDDKKKEPRNESRMVIEPMPGRSGSVDPPDPEPSGPDRYGRYSPRWSYRLARRKETRRA